MANPTGKNQYSKGGGAALKPSVTNALRVNKTQRKWPAAARKKAADFLRSSRKSGRS